MIDPGLAGRVALVTGANHGIGAATATLLAKQVQKVVIVDIAPEPLAGSVQVTLKLVPGAIDCVPPAQ